MIKSQALQEVTSASAFLMMPQSSQLLYFNLCVSMDDDGFCDYCGVMRRCEAKPDDLSILAAKKFVHIFDKEALLVIRCIQIVYKQSDRDVPSKYLEKYRDSLQRIHDVYDMYPGHISLSNNIYKRIQLRRRLVDNEYSDQFERFWAAYPKKVAKKAAYRIWFKIKDRDALIPKMLVAIEEQKKSDQWLENAGNFIPHPATWLNGERWTDQLALPTPKSSGSLTLI